MNSYGDEGQDYHQLQMETFIEEVRRNEVLWNEFHSEYRNRKAKKCVWARVGAKFNIKSHQAQTKWKNLRDRYRKHKKELQTPGSDQTITRIWYLYKLLTFIDSGCQSTLGSSTVNPPSESSQTNEDTMEDGNSETNLCSLEEINVKQERCSPDLSNSAEDLNTLSCNMSLSTNHSEGIASNSHVNPIMPVIQDEGQDVPLTQMELFIEEVRNNEILWNELHPKYKNKKMKERIWLRIGAIFKMKSHQAQRRWKNLRDRYKKIKKELQMPGSEQTTTRVWYLYKYLTFLDLNFPTTSRLSTANQPSASSQTDEDTMDDDNSESNLCNLEEINVKEEYCTTPDLSNNVEDYTDNTLPCDESPSTSCVDQFMPVTDSLYEDEGHYLAPQMKWFIEEVRNNEILWNRFNPDYKNKAMKEHLWLKIAVKFDMKSHQAQTRWKKLQDRYKKFKKELKTPGSEQTMKVPWYLYKFLTFLDTGCSTSLGLSRVNQSSESSKTNEDANGGNSEITESNIVHSNMQQGFQYNVVDSSVQQGCRYDVAESSVQQGCGTTSEQWCIDLNTLQYNMTPSVIKFDGGLLVFPQAAVRNTTMQIPTSSHVVPILPAPIRPAAIRPEIQDEEPDLVPSQMELFIEDVRNNEILWNKLNPDFKNLKLKDRIWLRVGAKYKMKAHQARRRWKNLQDRFKKTRKELQNPGSEQTITRVWYLYKFLKFLDPEYQTTAGSSNTSQHSESSKANNDTNDGNSKTNASNLEENNGEQGCGTQSEQWCIDVNTLPCDVTPSTSRSNKGPQTAVTGTTVPNSSCVSKVMPGIMNSNQDEGLDFPTSEMELFIEDVRNNEILWNRLNPDYKKKRVKDSIWLRVGAKYKMRPHQARCRWKNLQDRYKKFKKELQSSGSEQTITRVWYLYKFLKFLDRCPTTLRSSNVNALAELSKINEDSNASHSEMKLEEINVKEEHCTTPDLSDNFVDINTLMCDMNPSTSQSEEESPMLPQVEAADTTLNVNNNSVDMKQAAEAMDLSETLEHQNTTKDEDALFLISHLNDLKSLPPEKKSKFKIVVSSTLHKYRFSCDNTSPDMPTVCCIRKCNHSHLNCGLHNFPTDTDQRDRWAANIRRYDKNYQPKTHHRVCNCHFSESYFVKKKGRDGKIHKRLSSMALPTKYPVLGRSLAVQPEVQPEQPANEALNLSRRNDVLKVKQFLSQNMNSGNAEVPTSNTPQEKNPAWLSQLPQLAPKPQQKSSQSVVLCPPVMPTLTPGVIQHAASSLPSTSQASSAILQSNALKMDQRSSLGFLIPVKPYGNTIFAPTTSQDPHNNKQVPMPFNIVSSIPLQNSVVIQPSTSNISPSTAAASSSKKSGEVEGEVCLQFSDTEEFDENDVLPSLQGLCRICAEDASAEGKQMIEIFSKEGRERNIPDLIMQYLPIEVLETDRLPLKVCTVCINNLETCHELILKCKHGDTTLRRLLAREENREASPIPCFDDICESVLQEGPQQVDFVEHTDGTADVEMIKCTRSNCEKETRDVQAMLIHVSNVHKRYACSICWKHFKTIEKRDQHKVKVHEGMLLCDLCGESYLGRKSLKAHMENHVPCSERRFKCNVCGKGFTKNCDLKLHASRHSNIKNLKCPKCDKLFYHANDVRLHMQTHAKKGSFQCKQCLRSFTCKRYLALHTAKYHIEEWIFKCKTCEHSANKLKVLAEHCLEEHGIDTDELLNHCDISSPFQCDTCLTYFSNIMNLKEHKGKFHGSCKVRAPRSKIYPCVDCGDLFLSQIQCTYHAKYMHGDGSESIQRNVKKSFECATCARKFSSKQYLIRHMKTHKLSGVKQYKCQYCVSSFAKEEAHADHERMHRGETPYQCTYCLQRFPSSNVLERHKKTHTKPFICQYCGKGFAMKYNMTIHQRVHTGERPYKCKFCEKAYKQKPEMEFHQLSHSMEKKYKCSICNFGDNKMKLVIEHAVTQHGIMENIDDVVVKHNFS